MKFNATFCFESTHPFYLYSHPLKKHSINFPLTGNWWTAYLKVINENINGIQSSHSSTKSRSIDIGGSVVPSWVAVVDGSVVVVGGSVVVVGGSVVVGGCVVVVGGSVVVGGCVVVVGGSVVVGGCVVVVGACVVVVGGSVVVGGCVVVVGACVVVVGGFVVVVGGSVVVVGGCVVVVVGGVVVVGDFVVVVVGALVVAGIDGIDGIDGILILNLKRLLPDDNQASPGEIKYANSTNASNEQIIFAIVSLKEKQSPIKHYPLRALRPLYLFKTRNHEVNNSNIREIKIHLNVKRQTRI